MLWVFLVLELVYIVYEKVLKFVLVDRLRMYDVKICLIKMIDDVYVI